MLKDSRIKHWLDSYKNHFYIDSTKDAHEQAIKVHSRVSTIHVTELVLPGSDHWRQWRMLFGGHIWQTKSCLRPFSVYSFIVLLVGVTCHIKTIQLTMKLSRRFKKKKDDETKSLGTKFYFMVSYVRISFKHFMFTINLILQQQPPFPLVGLPDAPKSLEGSFLWAK